MRQLTLVVAVLLVVAVPAAQAPLDRDAQRWVEQTMKKLTPDQRKALVYDIERGKANDILPQPWQTDTCIGETPLNCEAP